MSLLTEALAPRSDQLNGDDLIAGPRVITITSVRAVKDGRETKLVLNYEGDNGKPFKPCKTMGRAMVLAWGITPDNFEQEFPGKSIRVFRDPEVTFGADGKVGGIRISHMSHIDGPKTIKLTVSQGKKRDFTFHPLVREAQSAALTLDQARADMLAADTLDALKVVWTRKAMAPHRDALAGLLEERKAVLAFDASDGPADSQRGEPHTQTAYAAAIDEIEACPTADAVDAAVARLRPVMETDDEAADLFNYAQETKLAKGWA